MNVFLALFNVRQNFRYLSPRANREFYKGNMLHIGRACIAKCSHKRVCVKMSPFVPLFPSSISFPFLCCKPHLRAFVCYIRQDTRIRGWGVKPIFPLPAFSEHLAMHSIPQKKVQFPAHPSSTPFGDHLVYLPVVLLVINHLNDRHKQ